MIGKVFERLFWKCNSEYYIILMRIMNIQRTNIKVSQEAVCSLCLNYFQNKKESRTSFPCTKFGK